LLVGQLTEGVAIVLDYALSKGGLCSQLIDQLGFRRHWEGCFDDRADGRTVSRLFGTNDHAGTLSNPQARRHRPPPGK
jgi:hypothetical protein